MIFFGLDQGDWSCRRLIPCRFKKAYLPSEVRHLFATGRANGALVEQPSWPIHKCNNQIFPKSSRAAAAAMAMTNNMTTILVMNKRTIVKSNVALWNKTVTAPICFDENDEAFGNDLLSNAVRIQLSFQTASVSSANVLLLAVCTGATCPAGLSATLAA